MTTTGVGSHARSIGLVLALGSLLVVLDTTVTVVAVPAIVAELGSSLPVISWTTTGYLLGVVAVIPTAGWLAARIGDRRVYVAALTGFTVFSLVAAMAPNAALLVAARVLQGLAGGLLAPIGQAIGLRAVDRGARGRMMSLLGLPVLVGPVLGPPLAGWLVGAVSWRAIFLINLPVGVATIVLCLRHLPTGPPRTGCRQRLDLVGLVLLPAGAVGVVAGASLLGDTRVSTAAAAAVLAVGLALVLAFAVHARRTTSPLLAVRLARYRMTGAGLAVLVAFCAAYFAAITVLPLIVQSVRGDPPAVAGLLGVPAALAVGLSLQVATRLVDRLPPRRIVAVGTGTALAGLLVLAGATSTGAPYPVLVIGTVILGAGSGATLMPTMTAALRDLPSHETAAGTTLLALAQQLAAAIGVATVSALLGGLFGRVVEGGVDTMTHLDPAARAALAAPLNLAAAAGYLLPAALAAVALLITTTSLRDDASAPAGDAADTPGDRSVP